MMPPYDQPYDQPYYRLEGTTAVPVEDVLAWGRWFASAERRVAVTCLTPTLEVSTVFIGLNHNISGHGPPLLFETMAFVHTPDTGDRSALDGYTQRYATWHEAAEGHDAVCQQLRRRYALG
jgi:hypothetical protein